MSFLAFLLFLFALGLVVLVVQKAEIDLPGSSGALAPHGPLASETPKGT